MESAWLSLIPSPCRSINTSLIDDSHDTHFNINMASMSVCKTQCDSVVVYRWHVDGGWSQKYLFSWWHPLCMQQTFSAQLRNPVELCIMNVSLTPKQWRRKSHSTLWSTMSNTTLIQVQIHFPISHMYSVIVDNGYGCLCKMKSSVSWFSHR